MRFIRKNIRRSSSIPFTYEYKRQCEYSRFDNFLCCIGIHKYRERLFAGRSQKVCMCCGTTITESKK